jgi:hypothetical protein
VKLAKGSSVDVQSLVQLSLPRGASEQEQLEVRDGNTTKELGLKKLRPSAVEDGELVARADVDTDEKKDSHASVQADSEADAETDVNE